MTDGDRFLIAMTVVLEAEGESLQGQQAVSWVIRNRMTKRKKDASTVCLRQLQFSCWNHNEVRRLALSGLFMTPVWTQVLAVVDAVFGDLVPDPTGGGTHYLNESVTRRGRGDGSLPAWFSESKVTARIGQHTFLVA